MIIITLKIKNALCFTVTVFLLACFFVFGREVNQAVFNSLTFCFKKLIPSLFPFMVISSILARMGKASNENKNKLCKSCLFRVCIISWLCGYIIGPRLLLEENCEDITEYIALTSNAGVGFAVSYIGGTIWGDMSFGIALYLFQILSSVFIFCLIRKEKKIFLKIKRKPFLTAISDSVSDSTSSVITICGFTVFFSAILCVIWEVLGIDGGNIKIIISCVTEISGGSLLSITANNKILCGFFTGFCLGFGGLCMCFQTFALSSTDEINRVKFLIIKLLQGLLCGAFASIYVGATGTAPITEVISSNESHINMYSVVICSIFVFLALDLLKKYLLEQIITKAY